MKFEASTFMENGILTLKLNGETVLEGTGRITLDLPTNTSFHVAWEVSGERGSTYTISVSSPPMAQYHLSKVIAERDGFETGFYQFITN